MYICQNGLLFPLPYLKSPKVLMVYYCFLGVSFVSNFCLVLSAGAPDGAGAAPRACPFISLDLLYRIVLSEPNIYFRSIFKSRFLFANDSLGIPT